MNFASDLASDRSSDQASNRAREKGSLELFSPARKIPGLESLPGIDTVLSEDSKEELILALISAERDLTFILSRLPLEPSSRSNLQEALKRVRTVLSEVGVS